MEILYYTSVCLPRHSETQKKVVLLHMVFLSMVLVLNQCEVP